MNEGVHIATCMCRSQKGYLCEHEGLRFSVWMELTHLAQEPLGLRRVCSEPEVWASWGGVPEADSGVKWDCGP